MAGGREGSATKTGAAVSGIAPDSLADSMRVLFEAIDDAVFVHDAAGNILEANPAACRRLGYTRDELLRLKTGDIDAPEFSQGFQERFDTQMRGGSFRCEGVHRARDGRRIPVDINTSAITINGMPAVLAVMRDITQRKQAEEALAKQGQLLRSILDNMGDAVLVADLRHRIVLHNPAAERIFGPDLLHGAFQLYLPDRITRMAALPLERCTRGECVDQFEVFIRHANAPRGMWGGLAGRPLRERNGEIKGAVLVCRDVTARKLAEKRLRAQYLVAQALGRDRSIEAMAVDLLQVLGEALDFDAGFWWSVEPAGTLACLAAWQIPDPSLAEFLVETRLCLLPGTSELPVEVLCEGRPRLCEVRTSAWAATPRWTSAAQAGLHMALAFPAQSATRVLGVLEFWSRAPEEDTDEALLSLAQATGDQIGQFLERQHVEKALEDSEALFHSLVQCLPQNIFRKDCDGRFTFCNQRFCDTVDRPLEELIGKTDFDLFPYELAAKYVEDDRRIMRTGETLDTVEQHHPPDAGTIYVHVVKTPVRDAAGQVAGVQGIFWDVTEQVRAEQGVAESERRYRQLTEATMDGIVLIDATGRVELFNPAAERMFGYQAAEMMGQLCAPLVPDEFGVFCETDAQKSFRTRLLTSLGKPQECKGRRKDGTVFPVEIALSVLDNADDEAQGLRFLAAMRDLTDRNRMRSVLVQNEKLASIGLLSAGVAHEINNPLAFVGNNLVVLERDCTALLAIVDAYAATDDHLARAAPEAIAAIRRLADEIDLPYVRDNLGRMLRRTREGIDRVSRIVHSLRGLARTDPPRRQEVRLPDLIESSLEIVHGRFKPLGVAIEQRHDANPVVPCVSTQISQVILNLLVNAFQAIEPVRPQGGRITIRTERRGEEMLLEIGDNGGGIDPKDLPKLFDPFFTTKDVGVGTGLGLSISHHIVAAHGGRIEVDSALGRGSCFRVYLPLKEKRERS
jgi:PAS domain S-box-containing protein